MACALPLSPQTALVGGSWAIVLGGTLLYIKNKKIPLQLKIIQARIVAQGALLAGCVRVVRPAAAWHLVVAFLLRALLLTPLSTKHPHPPKTHLQGIAAIVSFSSAPEAKIDPRARFTPRSIVPEVAVPAAEKLS